MAEGRETGAQPTRGVPPGCLPCLPQIWSWTKGLGPSQSPLPQSLGCVPLRPLTQAPDPLQGSCTNHDARDGGRRADCPHLILTVLANHLQGTLGDQWRLEHNLSEDPAREEGGGNGYGGEASQSCQSSEPAGLPLAYSLLDPPVTELWR